MNETGEDKLRLHSSFIHSAHLLRGFYVLSSGVTGENMTDVISTSWKLGLVSELRNDTHEGTHSVPQTYFNILQDLMFQEKESGKYFVLKAWDARLQHIS